MLPFLLSHLRRSSPSVLSASSTSPTRTPSPSADCTSLPSTPTPTDPSVDPSLFTPQFRALAPSSWALVEGTVQDGGYWGWKLVRSSSREGMTLALADKVEFRKKERPGGAVIEAIKARAEELKKEERVKENLTGMLRPARGEEKRKDASWREKGMTRKLVERYVTGGVGSWLEENSTACAKQRKEGHDAFDTFVADVVGVLPDDSLEPYLPYFPACLGLVRAEGEVERVERALLDAVLDAVLVRYEMRRLARMEGELVLM
ncbi:hypothetical protein JCM8547_008121 [Rhodosporidiobolus lusitaniae]